MRISLVRISLLRFFKTFQKYLAYAFLGYLFHYCDFCTWLMQFWGYLFFGQKQPKNCTNEINSPKFALGKLHKPNIWLMRILANSNFSQNQKSHQARTLCTSKKTFQKKIANISRNFNSKLTRWKAPSVSKKRPENYYFPHIVSAKYIPFLNLEIVANSNSCQDVGRMQVKYTFNAAIKVFGNDKNQVFFS